jgi:hypothetical protein
MVNGIPFSFFRTLKVEFVGLAAGVWQSAVGSLQGLTMNATLVRIKSLNL